ncbi:MAG: hypothetical protein KKB66_04995 [Alphaproteobacteria bacterium]|nr:hypothetical protein [Alphaproteobacteria bacterium]MBU0803175.1 hypothetical protein [Alphaproteobacteria bacterium]MBU0873863.1 hypothetical protein [Alphaproteobacteria bacterium]MBU1400637.1 hypothetical protein [Alphaproteobacteria bacterium]MBU1590510.1 hypothetical protein [Alphaproteobacteria bacterium]
MDPNAGLQGKAVFSANLLQILAIRIDRKLDTKDGGGDKLLLTIQAAELAWDFADHDLRRQAPRVPLRDAAG